MIGLLHHLETLGFSGINGEYQKEVKCRVHYTQSLHLCEIRNETNYFILSLTSLFLETGRVLWLETFRTPRISQQ